MLRLRKTHKGASQKALLSHGSMQFFNMKQFGIFICLLLVWMLVSQSCLRMRTADNKAYRDFGKKNIPFRTYDILVGKRQVHCAIAGSDSLPTLYFVHGSPGSWDAFEKYMQDMGLLGKFRMVSIDRPGFGYSDFGRPQHLEEQSCTISPLFAKLKNGRPAFIVGHSLGGPMVVQLATDNPGFFSGLVILAGSIDPVQEAPEKWRHYFMAFPLCYFLPGAFRPSNREIWYLKKDLKELGQKFKLVTCPVHILHGDKDQFVPYPNMAFGKKMLVNAPKVDTITLSGANHFIPWTHFREIKQVLMGL